MSSNKFPSSRIYSLGPSELFVYNYCKSHATNFMFYFTCLVELRCAESGVEWGFRADERIEV